MVMDYPALRAGLREFNGFQRNPTVSGVKLLEVNGICERGVIIRLGNGKRGKTNQDSLESICSRSSCADTNYAPSS